MRALFWLRYSVRSLHRSGRRALFALVCIAVGVASVVALQTATLTVQTALTSNVRAANGGDLSVISDASPISRKDLRLFRRLQQNGTITSWTGVYSVHATALAPAGQLLPFDVRVISSPPYPLGGEPTFVTPGNGSVAALLRKHGDGLISAVLADELGAHVGDRLIVNSVDGRGLHVTVRGILAGTSFEHAAVMTVEQRDASVLSLTPPRYTEVYATVPGDARPVAATLRRSFPLAQIQTVQDALDAAKTQVHDFQQFMLLVGLLALLVAGIGILNAMQSILAWRRTEVAMIKAMGFPQRTLYGLFGMEAMLLGFAGGVAGTLLGAAASKVITDALGRAMALQVSFKLDPGTLVGGVGLGVGTTLVFAVLPIVRAAAFRPIEILRDGMAGSGTRGLPQTLGLVLVVLLLFAGLSSAIMGDVVLAGEFVAGAAVAFTVLTGLFALLVGWIGHIGPPKTRAIGVAILAVLLIVTVLAILKAPPLAALLILGSIVWGSMLLPRGGSLPVLVAARSLSRRRARTSVTLVAFLVGVLAMSITLTVALSLRGQILDALSNNGAANLVAIATPANEAQVVRAAHRLPGIQKMSVTTVVSTSPVSVNGRLVADIIGPQKPGSGERDTGDYLLGGITGINLAQGQRPVQIEVTQGRPLGPVDRGTDNVLVRDQLRFLPWNLSTGDKITMRDAGSGNTRSIHVVGFYKRTQRRGFGSMFTAPVYGDRSLAVQLGASDAQSILSFTVASANLTHDATTLQRTVSGILVIDVGDLTRVVDTILGELLNLLAVITALALGAGLAVVGNGVALSMFERRREIALYKAIGFSPASVLRFVLVENALAGTLAGAVSVVAVVITLGIISRLALSRAIGFDPLVAALVLLLAAALAVGTAYLAARKPIGVRPIEALRNE